MGYNITIGTAFINPPDESEAAEWPHIGVRVEGTSHPDAPTFPGDGMTGNGSTRSPSYSAWAAFCRNVGLHRLFYGREAHEPHEPGRNAGLMSEHPGAVLLTKAHHAEIAAALDRYRTTHPGARPGWPVPAEGGNDFDGPYTPETINLDGDLARLIWLEWWVRWALDSCAIPALRNT